MYLRRSIGLIAAIAVTGLTGWYFYRSVTLGDPNWKMLIMSCGMALFILFIAFSGNGKRQS